MIRYRTFAGPMILVAVGVIALLVNLGWLGGDALLRLLNLWPLILVVLGLSLVWRSSVSEPARAAVLELATVSLAFLGAIAYAVTGPALPSASSQSLDSSTAIGAASQARLDLNAGAGKITLQSGDLGSDLYQAHLTYPGGDTPNITFDRSTAILHISFPNRNLNFGFVNQQRTADIRLSSRVPWAISVSGGATRSTMRLSSLQLKGIEASGGANEIEADLPPPQGTVRIDVSGGTSNVTLHRPTGSQARIDISGGASNLSADGKSYSSLGGNVPWQSDAYASVSDRYDITISGGASRVSIDSGP